MKLTLILAVVAAIASAAPLVSTTSEAAVAVSPRDGTTEFDPDEGFKLRRDGTTEFDPDEGFKARRDGTTEFDPDEGFKARRDGTTEFDPDEGF